jgi:hypothetical protein
MAEAFAGAIDRIGVAEPKTAPPKAVPKAELRPIRRLPKLVGRWLEKRIGQKNCDLLLALAIEQAQSPRHRRACAIEASIKLGARGPPVPRQLRRRAFMRADAKVKVRHAESNREVAVDRSKIGRRRRQAKLISRALDDGAEDDVLPMLLEQIAEQVFERPFICRKSKMSTVEPSTSIARRGRAPDCGVETASTVTESPPDQKRL